MGLFKKSNSKHSPTTLIAKGCQIEGQFKVESNMHVDGSVIGQVTVEQYLIVCPSGRVTGDVFANKIIVGGIIEGSCYATSVEILENGRVKGAIFTDDLSIERGGKLNGDIKPAEKEQVVELGSKDKSAESKKPKQVVNG